MMLMACPLACHSGFNVVSGILKSRLMDHDSAFFVILYFILFFWLRFVLWAGYNAWRPCVACDFFIFAFVAFTSGQQSFNIQWIRKRSSLKQSITHWSLYFFCFFIVTVLFTNIRIYVLLYAPNSSGVLLHLYLRERFLLLLYISLFLDVLC